MHKTVKHINTIKKINKNINIRIRSVLIEKSPFIIKIQGDIFYQIVDFRGKVRKSQKITDDAINLEISDLESGMYIIQMVSKMGVVESKTLIKE